MIIIRKIGVVTVIICIIIILFIIICNNKQIYGWNEFKKGVKTNYSFIDDVNVESHTPPYININYHLNRKIDRKEVDKLFFYTKEYIFSEKVFIDLQKYHIKKYDYSFSTIKINLIYKEINQKFLYQICLTSDVGDEPSYKDFNIWDISFCDGPTESYIPKSE